MYRWERLKRSQKCNYKYRQPNRRSLSLFQANKQQHFSHLTINLSNRFFHHIDARILSCPSHSKQIHHCSTKSRETAMLSFLLLICAVVSSGIKVRGFQSMRMISLDLALCWRLRDGPFYWSASPSKYDMPNPCSNAGIFKRKIDDLMNSVRKPSFHGLLFSSRSTIACSPSHTFQDIVPCYLTKRFCP